jgi:DNA-binding NarL/FixJ family response regulator
VTAIEMDDDQGLRVVVLSDNQLSAAVLARAVDQTDGLQVLAHAWAFERLIPLLSTQHIDVVLAAYLAPAARASAEIAHVRRVSPCSAVVVLAGAATDNDLVQAVRAGASGIVSSTASLDELTSTIRLAADGETVLAPALLSRIIPSLRIAGARWELTDRELDVLQMLGDGTTTPEIARCMSVSVNTVRNHIQHILKKLGAHSKLEAVTVAIREGIIRSQRVAP